MHDSLGLCSASLRSLQAPEPPRQYLPRVRTTTPKSRLTGPRNNPDLQDPATIETYRTPKSRLAGSPNNLDLQKLPNTGLQGPPRIHAYSNSQIQLQDLPSIRTHRPRDNPDLQELPIPDRFIESPKNPALQAPPRIHNYSNSQMHTHPL